MNSISLGLVSLLLSLLFVFNANAERLLKLPFYSYGAQTVNRFFSEFNKPVDVYVIKHLSKWEEDLYTYIYIFNVLDPEKFTLSHACSGEHEPEDTFLFDVSYMSADYLFDSNEIIWQLDPYVHKQAVYGYSSYIPMKRFYTVRDTNNDIVYEGMVDGPSCERVSALSEEKLIEIDNARKRNKSNMCIGAQCPSPSPLKIKYPLDPGAHDYDWE